MCDLICDAMQLRGRIRKLREDICYSKNLVNKINVLIFMSKMR